MKTIKKKDFFTTGEAAKLCSVTPDTVLKWIRAGKIQAQRTPGGHHRIPLSALTPLLQSAEAHPRAGMNRSFRYCWEYNAPAGVTPDGCRECIVYRSRTLRCYEMAGLPEEAGHVRLFCEERCDECDYYRTVRGQPPNVLIVTDKSRFKESLEKDLDEVDYNLQFTDCEYRCSMLIERYRPDFIVIDCSLGAERSEEFAKLLNEDPRIPFVRIILAGNREELPTGCDRLVFASIDRYFDVSTLSELIEGSKPEHRSTS